MGTTAQNPGRILQAGSWLNLAPDRFWNSAMDEMISADNEGPCMGIELKYMGARQGGYFFQTYILYVHYDYYIS